MINKRYLKYTLLLFTFGMTACSDFLDEVNHSSQSADKYYQTKGGYESLIVGCYSNLKNIYNTTTYQIFTSHWNGTARTSTICGLIIGRRRILRIPWDVPHKWVPEVISPMKEQTS